MATIFFVKEGSRKTGGQVPYPLTIHSTALRRTAETLPTRFLEPSRTPSRIASRAFQGSPMETLTKVLPKF